MQKRKRQQAGQLFKAGGWWYLRYYDSRVLDGELKRVRIAKQLAPVQGTTKSKARDLAVPILDSINKPRRYAPETAVRLSDLSSASICRGRKNRSAPPLTAGTGTSGKTT